MLLVQIYQPGRVLFPHAPIFKEHTHMKKQKKDTFRFSDLSPFPFDGQSRSGTAQKGRSRERGKKRSVLLHSFMCVCGRWRCLKAGMSVRDGSDADSLNRDPFQAWNRRGKLHIMLTPAEGIQHFILNLIIRLLDGMTPSSTDSHVGNHSRPAWECTQV